MAPLSRDTRLLLAGDGLSAVGTGLVLPLLLIYLHQVRHIPLTTTGLLLAVPGVIGLAAVPLSGVALDRFGPRNTLLILMVGMAVAETGLAFVHSPGEAIPVLALLGVVQGATFPAYTVMLATVAGRGATQQRAFAVNFTVVNAGIGTGSVVGGLVVDVHRPVTFMALFLGNAVSFALFAAVIARLPDVRPRREVDAPRGSYRDIAANRPLLLVVFTTLLLALTGYAALDSGLPAYATVVGHVSVRIVALALGVNTALIVVSQLLVLRLVRHWRRSTALAAVGVIWAVSWALFSLCALPGSPGGRDALVFGFAALFGVGETFMAPTVSPLINSLAGDAVRGRANALSSSMYALAFVISPSISAFLISSGLSWLWITGLCLGCCVTVVLSRVLRRRLPLDVDRLADAQPVPEVEPQLA
ncbi:MAG TPA: MFS transporter [Mycobacteriales bacterium]|jgi:MFS family permease|nr:MFS transporter [Mycobacteriales bacterium]